MGTILPLTLAPTHLQPTAVWTLNAKSRGVDPAGSSITSPFGVNTNTWLENRSTLTVSMNSPESFSSCCHSRVWRSQASFTSSSSESMPSLYFQWAAMPYSATWCISFVRIWISKGLPLLPMTVVCSDWYRFGFGMAI